MTEDLRDEGGDVFTEKTEGGTVTVIATTEGVTAHFCPGGITEDELLE